MRLKLTGGSTREERQSLPDSPEQQSRDHHVVTMGGVRDLDSQSTRGDYAAPRQEDEDDDTVNDRTKQFTSEYTSATCYYFRNVNVKKLHKNFPEGGVTKFSRLFKKLILLGKLDRSWALNIYFIAGFRIKPQHCVQKNVKKQTRLIITNFALKVAFCHKYTLTDLSCWELYRNNVKIIQIRSVSAQQGIPEFISKECTSKGKI